MSINYEELSSDELRMEIAKRLGYTIDSPRDGMYVRHVVRDPSGRMVSHALPEQDLRATLRSSDIPNWPNDCNVALALLPDQYVVTMSRSSLDWGVTMYVKGDRYYGSGITLAWAICVCWLLWQDAQKKPL